MKGLIVFLIFVIGSGSFVYFGDGDARYEWVKSVLPYLCALCAALIGVGIVFFSKKG